MNNSQKIRKLYPSSIEAARAYFSVMNALNNLELTNRELELLSYLAVVKGEFNRAEYIREYKMNTGQFSTLVHWIKKKGVLVRDKKLVALHPALAKLDFSGPVTLDITIDYEQAS